MEGKIRQIFISEHIFMILSSRAGEINFLFHRIVLRQIRFEDFYYNESGQSRLSV